MKKSLTINIRERKEGLRLKEEEDMAECSVCDRDLKHGNKYFNKNVGWKCLQGYAGSYSFIF